METYIDLTVWMRKSTEVSVSNGQRVKNNALRDKPFPFLLWHSFIFVTQSTFDFNNFWHGTMYISIPGFASIFSPDDGAIGITTPL